MVKNLHAMQETRLGRSPGEGKGYPFQYSGLENSMDSPWGSQNVRQDWATFTFTFVEAEVEAPKLWLPDAKKMTHWKRPWCWQRLKAGGEGDNRGWDGWMASPTQWTWVWASCRSWWWTGRPGVLQSMGSQEVGHDLLVNGTELNLRWSIFFKWKTFLKKWQLREIVEERGKLYVLVSLMTVVGSFNG